MPQRAIPQGLGDASENDGINTPFMKHVEGEWDVKVVGYAGARTPKLGIACHISFEIIKSSDANAVPVGTIWRVAYKYDYERKCKADLDVYGGDVTTLSRFLKALFNGVDLSAPGAIEAAEASLHTHDWAPKPAFVHLSGRFGKAKEKNGSIQRFRNDYWFPFKAS